MSTGEPTTEQQSRFNTGNCGEATHPLVHSSAASPTAMVLQTAWFGGSFNTSFHASKQRSLVKPTGAALAW